MCIDIIYKISHVYLLRNHFTIFGDPETHMPAKQCTLATFTKGIGYFEANWLW